MEGPGREEKREGGRRKRAWVMSSGKVDNVEEAQFSPYNITIIIIY